MTAKEKFEARLKELGLMEEWTKQGKCGRVAVEREDGIILMVHENNKDKFTEEHFPTFSALRKNPKFVEECKEEWYADWDDDRFVRNLACWLDGYSDECPLFPVDVYFPGNEMMTEWKDFEDDEDEDEEEYQRQIAENADEINVMQQRLSLDKHRLEQMIKKEVRRGHNLQVGFDPYPGRGAASFYGYLYKTKTFGLDILGDDSVAIVMYEPGRDNITISLSDSDFPIEVLFNIYKEMK